MIPVFIGFDREETVAYHVLAHSILSRSSEPVSITPLYRKNLSRHFHRPRAEKDSTDFSNSRWVVPQLCDYKGWAIFMDCDMLCLEDINELWKQRDDQFDVMVRKHNYQPEEDTKFLNRPQYRYEKKNWSSLILFNNAPCRHLTKKVVNTQSSGLWFHQFKWTVDEKIGDISEGWNHLVGHDEGRGKLVHFTEGGPWHGYNHVPYASNWYSELDDMLQGDNPVTWK